MKLFVLIFLALGSKSYADVSEEDSSQLHFYSTQKEWNNLLKAMTLKPNFDWRSSASLMPGAMPFKQKVTQRIQNSTFLRDMPHIQEQLNKLADEKLEKCMTPSRQELDRRCVGRATGQIMQFISAVENSGRNTAYTWDKQREERDY